MSQPTHDRSWTRTAVAGGIGLAGAIAIWVATPYNAFLLRNSNVTDSYLPAVVVLIALVLVLGVNPLLRWMQPSLALTRRQLALILGVLLVACVVPGQGTLRCLTFGLAKTPLEVRDDKPLAEQYGKMDLPPGLFPDRLGYHEETPAGEGYVHGQSTRDPVPWKAWVGPAVTWGVFLAFSWMMMMGLAMVALPQWRHNERLAFPLVTVQQALIEPPQPGRLLPGLLYRKSFWVAVLGVFLVYFLFGAKKYYEESVPEIPLKWDLSSLFADETWQHMPGYLRISRVYFLFVGIAFFMPARISLSIWFFLIAYGLYRGLAPVFGVGYYIEKTDDQRFGAVVVLTVCVLWIGRAHWREVLGSLWRRPRDDRDRRNRSSGWLFLAGIGGMFAWMVWLGVSPGWALMLVAFAFMVTLLISRIVAETGMPFVRINESPLMAMRLAPIGWLSPVSLFMAGVMDMIFSLGSRVSAMAMGAHALALDERATPRQQTRLGVSLIGVLLVGLVIAGSANLLVSYRYSATLDGQPMHGTRTNDLKPAHDSLKELRGGRELSDVPYNRYTHFAFGAGLAGGLYYLCLTVPRWPIHPFGMMLVDSYYGHEAWASIFFGWLLQVVIVRFGGARLYRAARPLFLGLIIGEVAAATFWALVPLGRIAMGLPYVPVHILPL